MQAGELVKLQQIHRHYAEDAARWGLVVELPSVRAAEHPHQPVCPPAWPAEDGKGMEPTAPKDNSEAAKDAASRTYCRLASVLAGWTLSTLKAKVEHLAGDFNTLNASDIITKYELDARFAAFEFNPDKHFMVEDAKNDVQGPVVSVRIGPLKQAARAEAKVRSLREELPADELAHMNEPLGRYVLDFMRATCCFEDPFAMRLFFEALHKEFTVVRVKNKYGGPPTAETGNPSVLINVGAQTPYGEYIGEVQLILQAYLVAKQVQHKSYEAMRAPSVWDLLRTPLYKRPW